MRPYFTQFFILVALLFLSLPVGLSIIGCTSKPGDYCNSSGTVGQKVGTIANISLEPKLTGVSLSYGQTKSSAFQPTATDCHGTTESVSSYKYGIDVAIADNIADLDPSGNLCAGTWNRNSAGGIANYTICTPATSKGVAHVTASANGVTSNTVAVYIHPAIKSIAIPTQTACVSQGKTLSDASGTTLPLSANTVVTDTDGNVIPNGFVNGVASGTNYVGTITYTPSDSTIVTIDNTVQTNSAGVNENGTATAHSPGSTVVTATLSGTSSTAGYFYTCPPAKISLAYANGNTSATVTVGVAQSLVATVQDVNGVQLTGLSLDYTSTNPTNISVSSAGSVSATYPGSASITAICQPTTCNPAPINVIGQLGTGKPIVSNAVSATTTGRVSTNLWVSSPKTQNFAQLDLSTGAVGATVKMPYYPNSMVLSQDGSTLYFGGNNPPDAAGNAGTARELMIYTATTNTLKKEDTNVPGVVLAVSPDNSTALINDQVRQIFYLYTTSTGAYTSISGVGNRAQFTPDSKTLYIAGTDKLYVNNAYTGWSSYDLTTYTGATDLAITVPSVAAYLAGKQTTANGYCPNTNTGQYYPNADVVPVATDRLAATNDGLHILGASASTDTFTDIAITVPPPVASPALTGACPTDNTGLVIPHTVQQTALTGITPTAINQVVASPNSSIAFVTYTTASTTSGALLPYYKPNGTAATAGNLGTEGNITLSGGATQPLVGIFSPDNSTFFVGTAGDNLLHYIDPAALTDTQTVNPKLVDSSGNAVPPQFLAAHPRPTT